MNDPVHAPIDDLPPLPTVALGRYRQDVQMFYGDHDLAQLARGELSAPTSPLERPVLPLAV